MSDALDTLAAFRRHLLAIERSAGELAAEQTDPLDAPSRRTLVAFETTARNLRMDLDELLAEADLSGEVDAESIEAKLLHRHAFPNDEL